MAFSTSILLSPLFLEVVHSPIAAIGGNGPDYQAYVAAARLREGLSTDSTVEFLEGYMSASGPRYMPGLGETYRPVE